MKNFIKFHCFDGHMRSFDKKILSRGVLVVFMLFFGFTINANVANAQISFSTQTNLPVPGFALQSTTGDFNNDGIPDIVVHYSTLTNSRWERFFAIFLNDGAGGFTGPNTFNLNMNCYGGIMDTGDFNGDGNIDIVAVWGGSLQGCFGAWSTVHLGDGQGNFAMPGIRVQTGGSVTHVQAGDYNEDGDLDYAIISLDAKSLSIHYGNGAGGFSGPNRVGTFSGNRVDFEKGDINNDGHLDLIVLSSDANLIEVFRGNGNGSFQEIQNVSVPAPPLDTVLRDFNNDGNLDIATGFNKNGDVLFLSGSTNGTFSSPNNFAGGSPNWGWVDAGNFDGDNNLDIVTIPMWLNNTFFSVFPGDGAGTLGPPVKFSNSFQGNFIVAEDFNLDGKSDIAVLTQYSAQSILSVLFNSTSSLDLESATFFGGVGDQNGTGISVKDGGIFVSGKDAATLNGQSLALRFSLPPGNSPIWTALWPNQSGVSWGENFNAVTATGEGVYFPGQRYSQTTHSLGGKEAKSVLVKFDKSGPIGPSTGGAEWVAKPKFFVPYDGGEIFDTAIAAVEGNSTFIYAAGGAQPCSWFAYVLAKFDTAGNRLRAATDSSVGVSFNRCFVPSTGFSRAHGIATLNGKIFAAGWSNWASEEGPSKPRRSNLWIYDQNLNFIKRIKDSNNTAYFLAITSFQNAVYAAGSKFIPSVDDGDFLIQKFDENGNLIWRTSSGGSGTDILNGIVGIGSRLFAVGYTNSEGAGGEDAVILEIDPSNGAILSKTLFGGSQNDKANGVATDGTHLYVVGESRSIATADGNLVGQNDLMLLKYALGGAPPPDITAPVITPPPDVANFEATGGLTPVSIGTATATDDVSDPANITITNNAPVGGFPVGTTQVTWTATDEADNSATATQIITVLPLSLDLATQDVIDTLQDFVDNNPSSQVADKLEDAIAKLNVALSQLNNTPPDNQGALGNIEGAVGELEAIVNDGLLGMQVGVELKTILANASRQLAVDAIDVVQGGDPVVIASAQQLLIDGDAFLSAGTFKDAVAKYKDALSKAKSLL